MIVGGHILFALGLIVGLIGDVIFLAAAYRHGLWWFLGCLFIPIVWVLFFFLNVKETLKPFVISFAGFLLAGTGGLMAGIFCPC
jgi:hypothetical protein